MYRQYDFECQDCGNPHTDLVNVPSGEKPVGNYVLYCSWCDTDRTHDRLMSCPAPYMGEKPLNPIIAGGTHDTAGYKKLPPVPPLPAGAISKSGRRQKVDRSALLDRWHNKEYQSALKHRKEIAQQNKAKQKRADMIRKGKPVNMKRDKLPGDPKRLTS